MMRLALAMGRTLAELLAGMSYPEFCMWQGYDRAEGVPWPWLQTGVMTANIIGNMPFRKGTARPVDFMISVPPPEPPAAKQTPAEHRAIMAAHLAAFNARHPKGS